MSSRNVIIPSCHYGPVSPLVRRTPSDLRIYENQTGAHYHRAPQRREEEKKENPTSTPEGRETRERFEESLQMNIGNVSFSRHAESFVEIFQLPDGAS